MLPWDSVAHIEEWLYVLVLQLCPTLCNHMDYSLSGSSVHGIFQNTGVGSLSLLQGIFQTQGSNPGLPQCKWILYQLSHKGSPEEWLFSNKCQIYWCHILFSLKSTMSPHFSKYEVHSCLPNRHCNIYVLLCLISSLYCSFPKLELASLSWKKNAVKHRLIQI